MLNQIISWLKGMILMGNYRSCGYYLRQEGNQLTSWISSIMEKESESEVAQSLSHVWLFATPWNPTGLLCPWDFPGKNTGVGCHFLSQEIFLTQGLNSDLPHCRQTCYHLRVPNKYLFNLPKVFGHCLKNHLFSFHILFLVLGTLLLMGEQASPLAVWNTSSQLHFSCAL